MVIMGVVVHGRAVKLPPPLPAPNEPRERAERTNMRPLPFFLALAWPLLALAEPRLTPDELREIRLADGAVLKNVVVVSYGAKNLMAKWDGGRGTIALADLPAPLREKLAPPPAAKPVPPSAVVAPYVPVLPGGLAIFMRAAPPITPAPTLNLTYKNAANKQTLSGQVVVSPRGGGNLKLAGVSVRLFPAAAFAQYEKWAVGEGSAYAKFLEDQALGAGNSGGKLVSEALYRYAIEAHYAIWRFLPETKLGAVTDAEGRFWIEHDLGEPFVVFAQCRRATSSDEYEFYIWTIKSAELPKSGMILLQEDSRR